MKKAGELLAAFFDDEFVKKAQGYSDLSRSWKSIAGENIAAHSRIVDLVRSILVVEADHPGWIQILQTRQKSLLEGVSRRFPDLSIVGISFRLSRDTAGLPGTEPKVAESADLLSAEAEAEREKIVAVLSETDVSVTGGVSVTDETAGKADADRENSDTGSDPYDKITDEHFRETFKRLEQGIREQSKGRR